MQKHENLKQIYIWFHYILVSQVIKQAALDVVYVHRWIFDFIQCFIDRR